MNCLELPTTGGLGVGEYEIYQEDGWYWIVKKSGEGMAVAEDEFKKLIDDYYKENF